MSEKITLVALVPFSLSSLNIENFHIMLGACLCCRKKVPKNEFMGLEGMVTLKNPEDLTYTPDSTILVPANQCKYNEVETKRASGAPNRSLPDIPVVDQIADTDQTSEFYADVVDISKDKISKENESAQLSQIPNCLSKQSSLNQNDDLGTGYARVQTPPHTYDKVSFQEHPYAQLNSVRLTSNLQSSLAIVPSSSCPTVETNQTPRTSYEIEPEIPAASAIAGMVSASHELPYMTPPIPNANSHFSGDSQDSTKGYTSISVREPLAIILASQVNVLTQPVKRPLCDSHYTTVSDDSDETYAAIEDNNYVESETYAQIQTSNLGCLSTEDNHNVLVTSEQMEDRNFIRKEIPITVQIHSRQASFSSNTSSGGPSSSPKPEKRQANSPLPPTPPTKHPFNSLTSHSSFFERNCVTSSMGITCDNFLQGDPWTKGNVFAQNPCSSKNIEEMYAKVVKKNKFSASFQNTFSTATPKSIPYYTEAMQSNEIGENNVSEVVIEKKDHGYETIPGESVNMEISDGYAHVFHADSPCHKYEQLTPAQTAQNDRHEPNYETLEPIRSKDKKTTYNLNKESNEADKIVDVNGKQHFTPSEFESQMGVGNELPSTDESINYISPHDLDNDVLEQLP